MKFERAMAVVVIFAFATPLLALGDPFVYSDHWPSGTGDETATEVSIPDGTNATISTAEDVARVARLTAISLGGSAARVDYTASSALALAASVSGSGKFSALSAGTLTLSGDNSGLLSPGSFFFSNTAVTVASRYGLGSTGTAAVEYFFAGKTAPFHFSGGGLTNDAPIRIHQGTTDYNFVIGPDNANETLVFLNDFIFDGAGGSGNNNKMRIYFRNKVRFRGGTFGADQSTSAKHMYFGSLSGETGEVWVEENVTAEFYLWFLSSSSDLTVHADWSGVSGVRYGFHTYDPVVVVCEKSGLFDGFSKAILSGSGTIDLNGFDQTVDFVSTPYSSGKVKFTSSTPATLTMAKYDSASDKTSSSAKFSGKVDFTYAPATVSGSGIYTLTGGDALSDSCGTLTVGGAGHLVFANGAGWSGTNVVVRSGATLDLNSEKAMTNPMATLTVETGGALMLHSGASCMAREVTIAGETLDAGNVYTVAQLKSLGLPVGGDDEACIVVSGGSSEWHGWPTTPGAVAEVPAGLTVYVSDEDVATLEALGGINLGLGAAVICTNLTERLELSAPVRGTGSFQAFDSANIVLSGDNSRLLSPGCFFFSNTAVTVASRYGLGSTGTAALEYFFGGKVDPLHFVGAGLTNDAPLRIHQGTEESNCVIGPTNANETLVFRNDVIFDSGVGYGTNPGWRIVFRNKVRFQAGTFGNVAGLQSYLYAHPYDDSAEVWFEEDAKVSFYYWLSYGNLQYHVGWSEMLGYHYMFSIGNNGASAYAVCERGGLFSEVVNGVSGAGTFDLNGIDQSILKIMSQYGNPTFTSATPATLSVTSYRSSSDYYTNSTAKFSGKVNFTYNPGSVAGVYSLKTSFSDTTGALTVASGELTLADGAGWGGTNVTIRSGAKLIVAAASMPVAFGSRALLGHQPWTKLEIESGGTLELAASAAPAVVRSMVYNGQRVPAGTYTSSSGVGITGDGALRVRSSTDGEPGAMVIIY